MKFVSQSKENYICHAQLSSLTVQWTKTELEASCFCAESKQCNFKQFLPKVILNK